MTAEPDLAEQLEIAFLSYNSWKFICEQMNEEPPALWEYIANRAREVLGCKCK